MKEALLFLRERLIAIAAFKKEKKKLMRETQKRAAVLILIKAKEGELCQVSPVKHQVSPHFSG